MSDVDEDVGNSDENVSTVESIHEHQDEAEVAQVEAVEGEDVGALWHEESYIDMMNVFEHSSMPQLATTEPETSDDSDEPSSHDSGMIEK